MNNISLSLFYQQQPNTWFLSSIEHNHIKNDILFTYELDEIDNILSSTKNYPFKQKQILFLIYSIFKNNNFDEPFGENSNNGRPIKYNQYAFQGNNINDKIGIYHAHIDDEDEDILVWYFTLDYNEKLTLHFEYMEHPRIYKSTLRRIYNIPNGFNIDSGEFFENQKKLVENKVLLFNEFIDQTFYLDI